MREKYRNVICEEEAKLYNKVDGIFINGHKDATLSITKRTNGKYYRFTILEQHYEVIGEPGTFYLTHISTKKVKGKLFQNHRGR